MGNCTANNHNTQSPTTYQIPEFYYLCRKTSSLFHYINNKIESISLNSEITIYHDSIIGVIQNSYIIILGGTKSSGKLTKKAYALSIHDKSIYPLSKFPGNFSSGFICYFNSMLYVVSTKSLDLFSYDLASATWEQPKIHVKHREYNTLCNYSCYFQHNRIFLVCGQYNSAPNTQVFFIDLMSLNCRKHTEGFPEYLDRPICLGTEECAIVGGGYTGQGQANNMFFFKSVRSNDWEAVQGPQVDILEDYPPVFLNDTPIFFSYPRVLIKFSMGFMVCNLNARSLESTRNGISKTVSHEDCVGSNKSGKSNNEINEGMQERKSLDLLHVNSSEKVFSYQKIDGEDRLKQDAVTKDISIKSVVPRVAKKIKKDIVPMRIDYKPTLPSNFAGKDGASSGSSDESSRQ